MAIVQISRISHRSGLLENLPQLAKAELGYSVDQRRLFIGNGQLVDGAPETGNTEILTEYSDILNLANSYTFRNNDAGYNPQTGNAKAQYNAIAWNGTIYVAVGTSGHILTSTDAINWSNTDSGTTSDLLGIAYGLNYFVAVGANGTVLYSSNGTVWNQGTQTYSASVSYTSGTVVSYSGNSYLCIATTTAGILPTNTTFWTLLATGGAITYTSINDVTFGNGIFVLVTLLGGIFTSVNGITWQSRTSGVSVPLNAITYANGKYVAVGKSGTVVYSTDAVSWTNKSISSFDLLGIRYLTTSGGSSYIATAANNKVYYSSDAVTWNRSLVDSFVGVATDGTSAYALTSWGDVYKNSYGVLNYISSIASNIENFTNIYYSSNAFMALTGSGGIYVSADAITWTTLSSGVATSLNTTYYDGTTSWVTVGNGGKILTNTTISTTATTTVNSSSITSVGNLTIANGQYIVGAGIPANTTVVSGAGTSTLVLSNPVTATGTAVTIVAFSTFASRTSGTTSNLYGINRIPSSSWIAVGAGGIVITSPNLTTWTAQSSGLSTDLRNITVANLGGGTYRAIAVGVGGKGIYSANGTSWSIAINNSATNPSGTTVTLSDLNAVIYQTFTAPGAGSSTTLYTVVGDNGVIATSTNGTTWSTTTTYTNSNFLDIIYTGTYFFAVGDIGLTYLASQDSVTWTPTSVYYGSNLLAPNLNDAATNASYSVLGGQYGYLYHASNQYVYWRNVVQYLNYTTDALLYNAGQFIAVGAAGQISNSVNGIAWTSQSYTFGNSSTIRKLQDKLDDFVSVKDFGARGDGVTDDTEAINRALYEIYCRTSSYPAKKRLYFPAGNYIVSGSINVPTNARIEGEGTFNTQITQTANPYIYPYITWVMYTADNKQQIQNLIGLNGAGLPNDITISDLTLKSLNDGIVIDSASRVTLNNVRMQGPISSVTALTDTISGNITSAVKILGRSLTFPSDVNLVDCLITGFNVGLYVPATQSASNALMDSCTFNNLYNGVYLVGSSAKGVTLSNSVMDQIYSYGAYITNATNFVSFANYYKDVGDSLNGASSPVVPVIYFDSTTAIGCASVGDSFDRTDSNRVTETINSVEWNYTVGLRLGTEHHLMGQSLVLAASTTSRLGTNFYSVDSQVVGMLVDYTIYRNSGSQVRTGMLKLTLTPTGIYSIEDDGTQNADTGVTLGFDGTDLTYTSDSNGTGLINYAIRYLEML